MKHAFKLVMLILGKPSVKRRLIFERENSKQWAPEQAGVLTVAVQ